MSIVQFLNMIYLMKKGFCEFRGVGAREGSRDERSWDGRSMIENRLSYKFDILAWN